MCTKLLQKMKQKNQQQQLSVPKNGRQYHMWSKEKKTNIAIARKKMF